MAYDADLVLVGVRRDSIGGQWLTGGFSDFIDGVSYLFNYASAAGKPMVTNISWGSQSGPHDGTSLPNQAFDALTGPGKILVMSGGNDGSNPIHLSKDFTATDTSVSTFLQFTATPYKRTWIDIWGDTAKTFCVNTTLYHTGIAGSSTGKICIDGGIHDFALIAANGTDTCYVQVITNPSEYNNKPRVTLNIYNKATDSVALNVTGSSGSVDMWNEYYYYGYTYGYLCSFASLGMPGFVNGNAVSTVSDMGASKSTLLIGGYVSKKTYTDISGRSWSYVAGVGALCSFSSNGPMIDGRIKPDITAPGLTIATSVNSHDTAYSATGSAANSLVGKCTRLGKDYYYGEFSGTSAAAPISSGIVALLLQIDPTLTPDRVKDLLFSTAITDLKTGALPAAGTNTWGHGKINAYGAVRRLLKSLSVVDPAGTSPLDCVLYPNPNNDVCTLDFNGSADADLNITVLNLNGSVVLEQNWHVSSGNNQYPLNLSAMAKGIYLVKVSGTSGTTVLKTQLQ